MNKVSYIRWFNEIGLDDVPLVGSKNASLGEMYQNLTTEGVRVPNGFAVTAEAYRYVLEHNNAWQPLHEALDCESLLHLPRNCTNLSSTRLVWNAYCIDIPSVFTAR
jgi:phosphoenolpyruvate synthase/pyruvate phosphate dikinase